MCRPVLRQGRILKGMFEATTKEFFGVTITEGVRFAFCDARKV